MLLVRWLTAICAFTQLFVRLLTVISAKTDINSAPRRERQVHLWLEIIQPCGFSARSRVVKTILNSLAKAPALVENNCQKSARFIR